MKIRKGFVSNSSSSSFICDVSGETVEGMDLCLEEAGMYECEHGHVFFEEYLIDADGLDEAQNAAEDDDEDNFRYSVPEKYCPICSFQYIMEQDCVAYIQKYYKISQSEVYDYMKEKSKRLRKIRNIYWFELLESTKGISKIQLVEEIKSKFKCLDDLQKNL